MRSRETVGDAQAVAARIRSVLADALHREICALIEAAPQLPEKTENWNQGRKNKLRYLSQLLLGVHQPPHDRNAHPDNRYRECPQQCAEHNRGKNPQIGDFEEQPFRLVAFLCLLLPREVYLVILLRRNTYRIGGFWRIGGTQGTHPAQQAFLQILRLRMREVFDMQGFFGTVRSLKPKLGQPQNTGDK